MYIIKKRYEATENNPNFAGEIKDYYYGKAEHLIGIDNLPTTWEINTFGYTTLAGAKRGLKKELELAEWESKKGYWTVTAELIEI